MILDAGAAPRHAHHTTLGRPVVTHAANPSHLADAASRAQEKASGALHSGRLAIADGLDGAAARLNDSGDRVAGAAHDAADKLEVSASYVRKHNRGAMLRDMQDIIKAHPGKVVLGAVVLGFLAGRTFRRS
jgi:hypothetical protein